MHLTSEFQRFLTLSCGELRVAVRGRSSRKLFVPYGPTTTIIIVITLCTIIVLAVLFSVQFLVTCLFYCVNNKSLIEETRRRQNHSPTPTHYLYLYLSIDRPLPRPPPGESARYLREAEEEEEYRSGDTLREALLERALFVLCRRRRQQHGRLITGQQETRGSSHEKLI